MNVPRKRRFPMRPLQRPAVQANRTANNGFVIEWHNANNTATFVRSSSGCVTPWPDVR